MEAGDVEFESAEWFQYKERKSAEVTLPDGGPGSAPSDLRRGKLYLISNTYGYVIAGISKGMVSQDA